MICDSLWFEALPATWAFVLIVILDQYFCNLAFDYSVDASSSAFLF
jgi:hypothetical protein